MTSLSLLAGPDLDTRKRLDTLMILKKNPAFKELNIAQ